MVFKIKELRQSIAWRLTIWFFLLSLVPMGLLTIFFNHTVKEEFLRLGADNLKDRARLLAVQISLGSSGRVSQTLIASASDKRSEAFLVDKRGIYLAHSNKEKAAQSIHRDFGDGSVKQILAGREGGVIDEEHGLIVGYAAVPGLKTVVGVAMENSMISSVSRIGDSAFLKLGASMVLISIAAGVAIWILIGPMQQLTRAAKELGQGKFDIDIDTSGMEGELKTLAAAFRQMAEQIRDLVGGLERRVAERTAELERQARELVRSNTELEQFAYVASHDLQEPLRMVASYLQLLERRYRDRLDADARDFIGYAVDGAVRMKALIMDLLMYSRVGTKARPFEPTDFTQVLETVARNLKVAIAESGAVLTHDELPTVTADPGQSVQLLQNLIGNAIKFRRDVGPQIHVGAREKDGMWVFSVRDNGIGMEQEYFERIFMIFQRLHGPGEYDGTGIGLAISKKIVEQHGGSIWVQSEPGIGSTFFSQCR